MSYSILYYSEHVQEDIMNLPDTLHVINGEKGDLDCGEKPNKNNELRKTKTT